MKFKNNHELVNYLVGKNIITSQQIEHSFRCVDRRNYFFPVEQAYAYENQGSCWNGFRYMSSPTTCALAMEVLELGPNLSFLNITSSIGYINTMVGLIIGTHGVNHGVCDSEYNIDIANHVLKEFKTKNTAEFCEPVFFKGHELNSRCSRYDRVVCEENFPKVSVNYMKNLIKVGGVLVMPVYNNFVKITRISELEWTEKFIGHVANFSLPSLGKVLIPTQIPEVNIQLPPQMNPNVSLQSTSLLTLEEPTSEKISNSKDSKLSSSSSCSSDKEDVEETKDLLLENLIKATKHLQELLECPVCFVTLDSTVVQCKNGHGICSACSRRIDKCPACKQEFVVHHATLLGKIIESLPKTCVYADQGCSVIMIDKDHEKFCKFRPSVCRNALCGWSGCAKDVIQHVKTCVKNKICEISANAKESRCFIIDKIQNVFFCSPIIYNNELFWECLCRDVTTKRIVYRFHHVATSKPTHKYYFIVSFKKGKIEFKSSFGAVSDVESGKPLVGDEMGLFFPDVELEKFRSPNENGKYDYSIEVVTEELV